MSGRLKAIWIKRAHDGPMDLVQDADLRAGRGIVGNADQGGRRQVTLIEQGEWDAVVAPLGVAVDPAVRRANLLLEGVALADSRDRVLRVGSCLLKINGETRPCEVMEEAQRGLEAAMSVPWGGGAYAEVLNDSEIAVGDLVDWEASTDTPDPDERSDFSASEGSAR